MARPFTIIGLRSSRNNLFCLDAPQLTAKIANFEPPLGWASIGSHFYCFFGSNINKSFKTRPIVQKPCLRLISALKKNRLKQKIGPLPPKIKPLIRLGFWKIDSLEKKHAVLEAGKQVQSTFIVRVELPPSAGKTSAVGTTHQGFQLICRHYCICGE